MIARLLLLGLAAAVAAAQPSTPDAEKSSYTTHPFANGLGSLELPKDWKLVAERKKGEQRVLALPPGADPQKPVTSYLLIVLPIPAATPAEKVPTLVRALVDRLGKRMTETPEKKARTLEAGEARDSTLDGQGVRILPLNGTVGETAVEGRMVGRAGDRAIAVSLMLRPKGDAKLAALFARIDRSLSFKIAVPHMGWQAMLPASWSYEATKFGGRAAVTLAPRRLRAAKDPDAPRLIATTKIGDALGPVSPRQLATNVALNIMAGNKAMKQVQRVKTEIAGAPGTRLVLRGGGREMWIVAAKPEGATTAHLWMVVAGEKAMARNAARLRQLIASTKKLTK